MLARNKLLHTSKVNHNFNSLKWKDLSQAKEEVDKGMQMVSLDLPNQN